MTFGPFLADRASRLLLRDGAVRPLAPRAFKLLVALLEHAGEVVPKDDLLAQVWPGRFVEENNLAQAIRAIRRALDDVGQPNRYLQTVPGRGYRFVPTPAETAISGGVSITLGAANALTSIVVGHFEWLGLRDEVFGPLLGPGLESALLTSLANEQHVSVRPLRHGRAWPDGNALLLEGAIRRADGCVRVDARLVNGDGAAQWAHSFDGRPSGVLAAEDLFAAKITEAVCQHVGSARAHDPRQFDAATYFAYLRARYLLGRRTRASLTEAVELFNHARRSERLVALAWVGLAEAYALLGEYDYMPVRTSLPAARAAATRALATGASGEAYTALAEAKLYCDWDLSGAEEEYRRAMALEPRYATTHHWYGWYLVTRGRYEEGLAALHHAHSLDPQSLTMTADFGWGLMCAGQYDRAFEHLGYAKLMDPTFFPAPYYMAVGHIMRRQYEDALDQLRHAEGIESNAQVAGYTGLVVGMLGRRAEARERLVDLRDRSKREYVSPYLISLVHAGLGDTPRAVRWLTRAVNERAASLLWPGVSVARTQIGPIVDIDRLLGRCGFPGPPLPEPGRTTGF